MYFVCIVVLGVIVGEKHLVGLIPNFNSAEVGVIVLHDHVEILL